MNIFRPVHADRLGDVRVDPSPTGGSRAFQAKAKPAGRQGTQASGTNKGPKTRGRFHELNPEHMLLHLDGTWHRGHFLSAKQWGAGRLNFKNKELEKLQTHKCPSAPRLRIKMPSMAQDTAALYSASADERATNFWVFLQPYKNTLFPRMQLPETLRRVMRLPAQSLSEYASTMSALSFWPFGLDCQAGTWLSDGNARAISMMLKQGNRTCDARLPMPLWLHIAKYLIPY